MTYYERMRSVREDKDLKQQDIAEMLNIKQQQYSEYERGLRMIPINYLTEFCRKLNVSSDYILGLSRNLDYPDRSE
ncbi:MAG: helix-turn-helix domain-containing protein [Acetobacter sp.]|nr:helix-turn-helix domain-containing protein [Bacteroides sp.]MCM1341956.1 helix-turn-helix domain-containing protein [Acetobacter sp.]MCM1434141.1 helix-turn-helix domain-containing protein [Clostridiales bacterium]